MDANGVFCRKYLYQDNWGGGDRGPGANVRHWPLGTMLDLRWVSGEGWSQETGKLGSGKDL